MAKKSLKIKTARKSKPKCKCNQTEMEMALLEYVRCGYSTWEAEKAIGIHHTKIQRAWDALSDAERNEYRERAQTICDAVADHMVSEEIALISAQTMKANAIANLALDEIETRLKDPLRKQEIKDADLINIATKCITLVKENTQLQKNEQSFDKVTNIFNIFDNAIQEHLTISSMSYEEQ